MATYEYTHSPLPRADARTRELWLQHGAGFILFQDVRQYAIDEITETYSPEQTGQVIEKLPGRAFFRKPATEKAVADLEREMGSELPEA